MAAASLVRSRRGWPWVVAILVVVIMGRGIYDRRPRPGVDREAADYSARMRADPKTAGGEAALDEALGKVLAVTAAPDVILQKQQSWSEDRVVQSDGAALDVPPAVDRAHALLRQAGFWQRAITERPSTAELAKRCIYDVPYARCTVTAADEVPGSAGTLRYQVNGRFIADDEHDDAQFERDEAAAMSDPMVGTTMEIFAADPAGGWTMVLALTAQGGDQPRQIASPVGPILSITSGDWLIPQLYIMQDGRWRFLYQAAWMEALADRAPPGTCLANGFYLGNWPWPAHLIPELSRLVADPATLTVDTRYVGGHGTAVVHATLGVTPNELVLRSADIRVTAPASWSDRLLGSCVR